MMFVGLLGLLALQRGLELLFASSNTAQLRRRGAVERGAGHYPALVALHVLWFASMLAERWTYPCRVAAATVATGWAFLVWGQGLRWWTIRTLGRRWTTRVLVLPGAGLVENGPFRLLPHPNYLGVLLEIVGVPLIGGCWRTAVILGALHGAMLLLRIRVEGRALAELAGEPSEVGGP